MAQLLINCPETDKRISTGVYCSKAVYESSDFKNMKTNCQYCGETHDWDKEDAFFRS